MSKHILNSPKSLVIDALEGLAFLNPAVVLRDTTLLLRDPSKDRVHLLCGGGGGHEPAHAAFVGDGMLSGAVSGQVFASPNSRQVEDALDTFAGTKGALIIVKNYTGDVIQFGLARERWAATHPGQDTMRMVIVGDDVAVSRSQGALTGRRGLAATVLVYKIAGALARKGATLDEVEHIAKIVAERSGTIGVGLEHCHVPGTESSAAYLKADEVEIGMGIHNEPGNRKASPVPTAQKLVEELLTTITDISDKERAYVPFKLDGKDEVVLLVNNLGGLPEIELSVVVKEASIWLKGKNIIVQRVLSGTYMSSMNLPGFSITLVLLPREPVVSTLPTFDSKRSFDKDLIIECLDAPTDAPAWKWHYKGRPDAHVQGKEAVKPKAHAAASADSGAKGPAPEDSKVFLDAIAAALRHVIKAEAEITRFDTIAGDGDAGLTLKAGAEAVQAKLDEDALSSTDTYAAMATISGVAEKDMGGTSGGLYSIFFAGLSKGLLQAQEEQKTTKATAEVWARALELALNVLYRYTLARPPSRTLVDPLASFIITFAADPTDFLTAFQAAKEAANATRSLDATAGRAAYVDKAQLAVADVPDAGAWGVLKLLEGIREVLVVRS